MIRILIFIFLVSGCPTSAYAAELSAEKETVVEGTTVPDYAEYTFYQTDFLSVNLPDKRPVKLIDNSAAYFYYNSVYSKFSDLFYFRSSQNIDPGLESRDIAYPFHFFL